MALAVPPGSGWLWELSQGLGWGAGARWGCAVAGGVCVPRLPLRALAEREEQSAASKY